LRITRAVLAHATAALADILRFDTPADQALSRYFRSHRNLGQSERAFVAEAVFAVLRRKRSLEAAAGSAEPQALLVAALLRVQGLSARALEGLIDEELTRRIRQGTSAPLPPAMQADLPDWLWQRLSAQHGEDEALRLARGLLNPAPLDLRVNLARMERPATGSRARSRPIRPPACASRESRRSTATRCSRRGCSKSRTRAASCSRGYWRRAAGK
jgi:16S rRNA (cytosine967-C5)-methyltransferase